MSVDERNKPLLQRIYDLKAEHPFWGYRRIWAYLKYREGLPVNKKRIYRIMKEQKMLVTKNMRLRACRTPLKRKAKADYINQYWGIDMTKIKLRHWGWMYLVIVLDWYSKKIVGYSFRFKSESRDWLEALNHAVLKQFPQGIGEVSDPPKLISDNGCQPTSEFFMKACSTLGIKQIFTSWNNPKGNADTERAFRTLKEDLVWPHEWDLPFELERALKLWIQNYNEDFPHSSLNYLTPTQFEQKHQPKQASSPTVFCP